MERRVEAVRFSRKVTTWIASGCLFGLAASYYAFVFANRNRIPPENWDYTLQGGLGLVAAGVGTAINAAFHDRLEAWRTRRREKLKGSVLGYDLSRWFRRK